MGLTGCERCSRLCSIVARVQESVRDAVFKVKSDLRLFFIACTYVNIFLCFLKFLFASVRVRYRIFPFVARNVVNAVSLHLAKRSERHFGAPSVLNGRLLKSFKTCFTILAFCIFYALTIVFIGLSLQRPELYQEMFNIDLLENTINGSGRLDRNSDSSSTFTFVILSECVFFPFTNLTRVWLMLHLMSNLNVVCFHLHCFLQKARACAEMFSLPENSPTVPVKGMQEVLMACRDSAQHFNRSYSVIIFIWVVDILLTSVTFVRRWHSCSDPMELPELSVKTGDLFLHVVIFCVLVVSSDVSSRNKESALNFLTVCLSKMVAIQRFEAAVNMYFTRKLLSRSLFAVSCWGVFPVDRRLLLGAFSFVVFYALIIQKEL